VTTAPSSPTRQATSRPGVRESATREKWAFALAFLLVVTTVALYHPVKRFPFITFDDRDYVTRNFQIQSGLDWDTVQWAFTTFYASNWHPLTWLSHALDCQLFHLNPAGHHGTNVLLHAVNAGMLFWVLWRATGCLGRSIMVAALFALHPINVESVAWVAERKNLLSMFFLILALGAYRWYALKPRIDRYLTVALLFALGLMAKPQVITLPCVLLLWDYWPLRRMFARLKQPSATTLEPVVPARSFPWLLLEKVPLFALSAASAVLTIKSQEASGALEGVFTTYPLPIRLENAIVCYARYIGKALWPVRLAVFYPHPESWLNPRQVVAATLLLLAITALAITRRYLLVGWLWFVSTLIPMIGLIQVGGQAMADRYAYLSFIGLFIMICWGVGDLPRTKEASGTGGEPRSATWLMVASLAMLVALTTIAHRQIWYWRDSVTLWSHAVEVTQGNWMAEDFLGGLMMELGRPADALAHFYRAFAINPADPISNLNIASWKQYAGKPREAIEYYQRVLHSPRAPNVLKTRAAEGLQRTYRDLGITNASEATK